MKKIPSPEQREARNKYYKEWRINNPEKANKKRTRTYNKESRRKYQLEYDASNPEKYAKRLVTSKKWRDDLPDAYIIIKLKRSNIAITEKNICDRRASILSKRSRKLLFGIPEGKVHSILTQKLICKNKAEPLLKYNRSIKPKNGFKVCPRCLINRSLEFFNEEGADGTKQSCCTICKKQKSDERRDKLTDSFVKSQVSAPFRLKGIYPKVPPQLIEIQRMLTILRRLK